MMYEVEIDELLQVLEEIRCKEYPEIPADIIRNICITEYENQDDREKARMQTSKIIEGYLKNKSV